MQSTDLRVVKTLKQIDQALLTCLAEAPFEKITVEQLCRAALINRSTFYKYYTSKYDLMEQYLQRALDGFRRQVDVAFVNATPETIHNLLYQKNFENTLKFLHRHKAEYTLLWSIPLEENVFGRMVDLVHDAILETLPAGREGPVSRTEESLQETAKGAFIMRIAVTYENGRIFQHFGHTAQFKIYDVQDGKIVSSQVLDTNGSGHGALAGLLAALQVEALICGGIGGGARMALAQANIRLYGGVSGDADAAAQALAEGRLTFDPDAHCDHHGHHHEEGHACGEQGCGGHCGEH